MQNGYFRTSHVGEPHSITVRRNFTDTRLAFDAACVAGAKLMEHAAWEKRSNGIVRRNQIIRTSREINDQTESGLNARREKLRQLIQAEEEECKQALINSAESSEQRAARVREAARQLKASREARRVAQAEEAYDRQWKESCDDLRSIDSHFFTLHCKTSQQQQIDEKKAFKQAQKARVAAEDAAAERERQRLVQLDQQAAAARAAEKHSNQMALVEQITANRALAEQQRIRAQQEREIALALEKMDLAAAEQKADEEYEAKRKANRENAAANLRLQEERRMAFERDRAEQRKALTILMDEYRADTEKHAAAAAQWRADQNAYRLYLTQRKLEQLAHERELDRLIEEDVAREEAKRDLRWSNEAAARKKLMEEVHASRLKQVNERRAAREKELQQKQKDFLEIEAEIARVAELERQEQRAEQDARVQKAVEYESQMKLNAYRAQRQAIEKSREQRESKAAEEAYQARLHEFRQQKIQESKLNYSISK